MFCLVDRGNFTTRRLDLSGRILDNEYRIGDWVKNIFDLNTFNFPYEDIKFPGQASDERILFVTREAKIMLSARLLFVWLAGVIVFFAGLTLSQFLKNLRIDGAGLVMMVGVIASLMFLVGGSWWVYTLWKRSVFILTTRRLTKFIYVTPWNRYNLSLSLDKVVDTGAYGRGYFQALFGVGTFSARSSAGNREEKYFFIENVKAYEDLANYVNKVLFVYDRQLEKLDSFRPFIPDLKGQERKDFMANYPQFWS